MPIIFFQYQQRRKPGEASERKKREYPVSRGPLSPPLDTEEGRKEKAPWRQ